MKYVIATIRPWNIALFNEHFGKNKNFQLVIRKEDLTLDKMKEINPRYILFPHWSDIIPKEIWSNFECVVFHMADLPYGRGGSPLQNLIVHGNKTTVVSSLRVEKGLDTGPIYFKSKPFSLAGTAEEIYLRTMKIVFEEMIPYIIENNPVPQPQVGEPVVFKRRKPEDGRISSTMSVEEVYDLIRMLDALEYPKAFVEVDGWRIEFTGAELTDAGLKASVEVKKK